MALRRREVHEPPIGDQIQPAAVLELELLDVLPRLPRFDGERAQRRDLDLDVEVPRVREDRAVLQPLDVRPGCLLYTSDAADE